MEVPHRAGRRNRRRADSRCTVARVGVVEISAMIASFVTSLIAYRVIPPRYAAAIPSGIRCLLHGGSHNGRVDHGDPPHEAGDGRDLERFYRRYAGRTGWARSRPGWGMDASPSRGALQWTNWIAGVVAVYATLFGIGKVVFGDLVPGLITLVIALPLSPGLPGRSGPRRLKPARGGRDAVTDP